MSWVYLFIASMLEMGWPVGLKLAQVSNSKIGWIIFAVVLMSLSGYLLFLAQKTIPIGTAYAVWTGVGMVGTFFIGVLIFDDVFSVIKCLGVFLILSGVIILKLAH